MKNVFSNSQLCHVYANQSQSSGRNGNGSLYFENTKIWSYGSHYLAAEIHTIKGKKIALINSYRYSMATGGHLNDIQRAFDGLMPFFHVSDVRSLKNASKEFDTIAKDSIASAMKRMKVSDKNSIRYAISNIKDYFKEANKLRKLLGKAEIKPTAKDLDSVRKHYSERLARYKELNTPEMIAKRQIETARRNARKEQLEIEKQAANIQKFKAGENVSLYNLPYEILRVRGDIVQTSRGAEVPLKEAVSLYKALKAGKDVEGTKVGNFTFNGVTPVVNSDFSEDKIVRIGCHKILLSDAASLFELKAA